MIRLAYLIAAVLLGLAALSATARAEDLRPSEARVAYPFYAATLSEGPVTAVFYIAPTPLVIADPGAEYEVYATFARTDGAPERHVLVLPEGGSAEVVPHLAQGASFLFWREANAVHGLAVPAETLA
ncbi:MAG: hypothetical protein AAF908_04675, partial [Pseudomonadota bacterium]